MGCGAEVGGRELDGIDLSTQTVIEGVVVRGDRPVAGAYVRLLESGGEFTAEVPTDDSGAFRFFAAPGNWTLRTLAPRIAPVDARVTASRGNVAKVRISV